MADPVTIGLLMANQIGGQILEQQAQKRAQRSTDRKQALNNLTSSLRNTPKCDDRSHDCRPYQANRGRWRVDEDLEVSWTWRLPTVSYSSESGNAVSAARIFIDNGSVFLGMDKTPC